MALDARKVIEEYGGVFVDRNCLFVSTTKKLLTGYVSCEVIFPYYRVTRDLTRQLIRPFLDEVEGFLCPGVGDIVLLEHANALTNQAHIETVAVWADKQPDGSYRVERSGYEKAIQGKKVLILNDRISQGATTLKLIAEARRLDCEILGVSTLAGVSLVSASSLDVPQFHSLCTIDVEAFPADEIPERYCELPIVVDESLGHGAEFQRKNLYFEGGFIKLLS